MQTMKFRKYEFSFWSFCYRFLGRKGFPDKIKLLLLFQNFFRLSENFSMSQKVRNKIWKWISTFISHQIFIIKNIYFINSNFLLYGKFRYMVSTRLSAGKIWLPFYMQNSIRLVDDLTFNFDVRVSKKLHGHNCLFQLPVKLPCPFRSNTTSM